MRDHVCYKIMIHLISIRLLQFLLLKCCIASQNQSYKFAAINRLGGLSFISVMGTGQFSGFHLRKFIIIY